MEKSEDGLILVIDENGIVKEVKRDDFKIVSLNKSILELTDPMSMGKVLSFISSLKKEENIIGWEINLNIRNRIVGLFFAGTSYDRDYLIVASSDLSNSRKLFNDLMIVNNQQINVMRKVIKENTDIQKEKAQSLQSFNDLTELNNEMANIQRELAKKNQELKDKNAELKDKNAELDQFAYIVSHDLKAPLRGITSIIDIIEEDHMEDLNEDIQEMFKMVKKRSRRMDDLINGILSYARAGKMDTEISTFNLGELITEILDSIAAPASFNFVIPKELPEMRCSYVQLGQVFANLLGNAVKYHDKGAGTITLSIKNTETGMIRFSVIDDGPGIPEKYHKKLFAMFETANEESRTDSTGVGLAIVKKLVEQMGGEIGLFSEVGKGSEFWFTWPQNQEV